MFGKARLISGRNSKTPQSLQMKLDPVEVVEDGPWYDSDNKSSVNRVKASSTLK